MAVVYLQEGTRVTFELANTVPILREEYVSPGVGTVTVKGIFNQSAHIETTDGTRFRTLQPRKDKDRPDQLTYPVVYLPSKDPAFRLLSPLEYAGSGRIPRLRFTTALDDQSYLFKPISADQRAFDLWDGMETVRLVTRERGGSFILDATVLAPVPSVLVLLFPWLDSQIVPQRRS